MINPPNVILIRRALAFGTYLIQFRHFHRYRSFFLNKFEEISDSMTLYWNNVVLTSMGVLYATKKFELVEISANNIFEFRAEF